MTFEEGLNAFVPATAPNPCCRVHENLGPFEYLSEGEVQSTTQGPLTLVTGYRRCTVCQKRHFLSRARPEPGTVTIQGPGARLTKGE